MANKSRSRHDSQGLGKACGSYTQFGKDRNKRGEPHILVAKGADTPRLCITDRINRADLQVLEKKINVPEINEMGTHKYIRYETIDIPN